MSLLSSMLRMMRFLKSTSQSEKQQSELSLEYRERIFYVIFCDAPSHLYTPFLKKGFKHCYVIEKLEHIFVMFDPTRVGLNVVLPPCTTDDPLILCMMRLDPEIKVLEVATKGRGNATILRPKILSCVSVVQYAMGLWFWFCVTPHQLYRRLIKSKNSNLKYAREL